MRLGYILIYVPDVAAAASFYTAAFGLTVRFIHEGGDYAEMDTGTTALAFISEALRDQNGVQTSNNRRDTLPAGVEIAFVTETLEADYARALENGAEAILAPTPKPWGQSVAYVRDLNGFLVELCTPMSSSGS
jgi:lactoylglutathione lyase